VSRRVLIVDDSEDTASALALVLGMAGHDARAAGDAEAALALLDGWRPDAALIDINLPGEMDGHALAGRLRATLGPGVRLVALTGMSEPEDRDRAVEAGFDLFVVKPATAEQIEAALGG